LRRKPLLAVLPWLAAAAVFAQTTPAPAAPPRGMPTGDAERAAMSKLDGMVGRWEGAGWMDMGAGRSAFQGSETVQKKLKGVALLVEGDFTGKVGDGGQEGPVHTTLGVIFFDAKSGKYRFNSWLATGMAGERDLTLTSDGWQWEMQAGPMRIRYTASFAADTWLEIGERSSDGTTWQKFFEMTLKKKP
jgi:hypothetical protein